MARKMKNIDEKLTGVKMRVRLTFTDDILGGSPNKEDIYREFIASKAPEAPGRSKRIQEEIEAIGVEEAAQKGMTIFPKLPDGTPILYGYQIKGFFKSAASAYYAIDKKHLPAYKGKIDKLVFVEDDRIPIHMCGDMEECPRPLRTSGPTGERVALANSEMCKRGSYIEFTIKTPTDDMMEKVCDWLDYGQVSGIGQWRNSGKGRFVWEEIEERS